ncbi:hypothetical protein [Enterococcus avium]|uniref:hypothetical protein n=1 Tax=Enterococcus avium TaxID=33945 RepID=UPI001F59752D|nr:hypothetical protein [Enterococcus avium]
MLYAKYKGILIQEALEMPLSLLLVNFAIESNRHAEINYEHYQSLSAEEKTKIGKVKKEVFIFIRDAKMKA